MLRPTCAAAIFAAALLSGCSGQRTLSKDKLKSTATEVISIAAEAELFAAAAAQHHVPTNYVEGHPEYLRKQAQEIAKELAEGHAELSVAAQFDQLRNEVTQLIKTLNGLPANSTDPGWQQSQSQLNDIRSKAEAIRQRL
jgi:hypothetical protein